MTRAKLMQKWIEAKDNASHSPSPSPSPSPTPSPSPSPTPNKYDPDNYKRPTASVRRGVQGNNAYWVQAILYNLGYTITVDGDFGPSTEKVVIQFQKDYHLTADGSVGPATNAKLYELWTDFKNKR